MSEASLDRVAYTCFSLLLSVLEVKQEAARGELCKVEGER